MKKPKRAKSAKRGREAASVPPSPELTDWQVRSLAEVGRSSIGNEVVFGGGAALASVYLHHRFSEDLDWHGFRVESLLDMTINKVQTILTRFKARDFVDLYFLLQEGPERNLETLLELVRSKFEIGADRLTLAERLTMVRDIRELPRMLRPVDLGDIRAFFWERARELIRKG